MQYVAEYVNLASQGKQPGTGGDLAEWGKGVGGSGQYGQAAAHSQEEKQEIWGNTREEPCVIRIRNWSSGQGFLSLLIAVLGFWPNWVHHSARPGHPILSPKEQH